MRLPSVEHTPTVHREDDAQLQRRSDNRYRDADQRGERERRTREREVDIARYKAQVMEKSGRRKDYFQPRDGDEDQRGVLDDEKERKDRRRDRENIKRYKENESESDRNRDLERGRNGRTGVHGQDKEFREAHKVREREKDRNHGRRQPTERDRGGDVAREPRKEREQNAHRERATGVVDRRGKSRGKDDGFERSERERGLKGGGPVNAGKYGFGGIPEVHKELREEHPYVTSRSRELEGEFKQGRQHDRVRESDQRERRRDNRGNKSYLDRRFEPGNAELESASTFSPQPRKQHRYTPAHDETNPDSLPRKDLPKLSKHERNLAQVEAVMERRDTVPSAPPDLALACLRQATSPLSSRENQARYANLNCPSLPLGHHEKYLTTEQLSGVNPTTTVVSLGEIGRSKQKEHTIENDPNNVLSDFPPVSSAREMLAKNNAELRNSNNGRSKYDEWPVYRKRSFSRPPPLIDNNPSMVRAEKQGKEQLDH
ncbi:hypothetical protein C0992_001255, partial [Termitomyces sp. T32_za158]